MSRVAPTIFSPLPAPARMTRPVDLARVEAVRAKLNEDLQNNPAVQGRDPFGESDNGLHRLAAAAAATDQRHWAQQHAGPYAVPGQLFFASSRPAEIHQEQSLAPMQGFAPHAYTTSTFPSNATQWGRKPNYSRRDLHGSGCLVRDARPTAVEGPHHRGNPNYEPINRDSEEERRKTEQPYRRGSPTYEPYNRERDEERRNREQILALNHGNFNFLPRGDSLEEPRRGRATFRKPEDPPRGRSPGEGMWFRSSPPQAPVAMQHSHRDMQPEQDQRGTVRAPNQGQHVCRWYKQGTCSFGAACKYLHEGN
ncbi:hypothetical protein FH972_021358 [Carpinus fangiana]|uniref:C3H1-type domain-containing protein n=1 Tax=Carpinus fangiana TaxID=176857 RepID=A0A5N6KPC1_9ROSI|nr:hypothetical protein FH972_021358 [Carpinus fangiana]